MLVIIDFLRSIAIPLTAGIAVGLVCNSYLLVARRLGEWLDTRRLDKRLKNDKYTPAGFKKDALRATTIYVSPDCQDDDPFSERANNHRRPIFREIDEILGPNRRGKFYFILGESGMGKSEFLQQYYRYHWISARRSFRFGLVVVKLSDKDINATIKAVPSFERDDTVIFLDALDEDEAAKLNVRARFDELMQLCSDFRAVFITCRTQFLAKEGDIPEEVESAVISGPLGLSSGLDRKIRKIYISRLSRRQISKYLGRKFPLVRHPLLRIRAAATVREFGELVARPLILTFIEDLVCQKLAPKYTFNIYQRIVDAWLEREYRKKRLSIRKEDLLRFSEAFAAELFACATIGMTSDALERFASRYSVSLDLQEVRGRSLIAVYDGIWRFAHRSIMEFLLVRSLVGKSELPMWVRLGKDWTDVMEKIAWEYKLSGENLPCTRLSTIDLFAYRDKLVAVNFSGVSFKDANIVGRGIRDSTIDFGQTLGLTLTHAACMNGSSNTRWPFAIIDDGDVAEGTCCAIGSDGRFVLVGNAVGKIREYDLIEGKMTKSMSVAGTGIVCMAALTTRIYLVGTSEGLFSVDMADKHSIPIVIKEAKGIKVRAIDADPTREVIAFFGETDGKSSIISILRYAAGGHGVIWEQKSPNARYCSCALDAERGQIVIGDEIGNFGVWRYGDSSSGGRVLSGHKKAVRCCGISPDGAFAISGSQDGVFVLWDLAKGEVGAVLGHFDHAIYCCEFFRQSDCVVVGGFDVLEIWNWKTKKRRSMLSGHKHTVSGCSVDRTDSFLLTSSRDKTFRLWFPSMQCKLPRRLDKASRF